MIPPELPLSPGAYQRLLADAVARAKKRRQTERTLAARSAAYREFQARYRLDPAAFVLDCIRWERGSCPTDYQLQALTDLVTHQRQAVYGPHGLGKTVTASWAVHWFALTRDGQDWKIPTTASSWAQLIKYLWPEIHKWSRRMRWDVIGRKPYDLKRELLTLELKLATGQAFAIASDQPDLIEGAHADHLLFLYDEAKSVRDATFDATEGAFATAASGREAFALAVSTPGDPHGRFWEIATRKSGFEDWHVRHVTKDEAMGAGRITEAWVDQRARQWGAQSALYKNRVLGEFAAADEYGVIPLAFVEAANQRWLEWEASGFPGQFTGLGADVGSGSEGRDKSALAPCYDYVKIREIVEQENPDPSRFTMQLANTIGGILHQNRSGVASIDSIGLGAGVAHRLVELGYRVILFVASASTSLTDTSGEYRFANWRSAAWWLLREMLSPNSGFNVCLPPDDRLTGELTAPRWRERNRVISVEEKATIRLRLDGRSTDYADSVLHILIGPLLWDERRTAEGGQLVQSRYEIGRGF